MKVIIKQLLGDGTEDVQAEFKIRKWSIGTQETERDISMNVDGTTYFIPKEVFLGILNPNDNQ